MVNWAEQGRELWRSWLGRDDVPCPSETESLAKQLHHPVGENHPAEEKYQKCFLDRGLAALAKRQGISPTPFWPNSAPYAFCLTHDIDRVLATVHRIRLKNDPWAKRLKNVLSDVSTAWVPGWQAHNPYYNFARLRQLESEWGICSASYVLFERRRFAKALLSGEWQHVVGVYDPRAIKKQLVAYAEKGNEVGLHGSFDSWNSLVHLKDEVSRLESLGVGKVRGVRNHYLQFDPVQTLMVQKRVGVTYDSTLGFNFQNGFRCGTSFPFFRQGQVEIPFCLMDSALRYQVGDPSYRTAFAQNLLGEVRNEGGVFVCNWHLQVMNAEAFPQEMRLLESLVRQAQADGAWICRPRDVAAHWKQRATAFVPVSKIP